MSSLLKQFRYYAFISYSRKNSKAAAYLHKQLEHFRIPVKYVAEENRPAGQKFLRPVFRDRRDLESRGNSFTEDIKAALEHSRHLIVVCSPMSATSVWVNEEIKHFLATHNNDYSAIVPIILTGEPGSGDDTECLPEALRVKEITIRNLPSMIPDDGDDEKNGWENGVIQAMSYMLKVEREKIKASVDAEKVRQIKKHAFIGIFCSIIFAALTFWAFNAEYKAKRYAQKVQKLHAISEGSLNFFLDLLKSADTARGGKKKLTVVDAIKLKIPDLHSLSPWELQVDVAGKLGNILHNLGDYDNAANVKHLVYIVNKNNRPAALETAEATNAYAVMLISQGQYESALSYLFEAQKLYELNFHENLSAIARVNNNISVCYMNLRRYDKAQEFSMRSLELRLKVGKLKDIASSYTTLGLICYYLQGQENYKKSLNYHKSSLSIKYKIYSHDSLEIADSLYNIALVLEKLDLLQQAFDYAQKAYNIILDKHGEKHPETQRYQSTFMRIQRKKSGKRGI